MPSKVENGEDGIQLRNHNDYQLKLYKAEKLGVLDPALAVAVRTMTAAEKRTVLAALEAVSKR